MGELIQRNDFEVPDSLIEQQIDIRLERGLRALAAQGLTAEQMKKMDLNRLRAGQREQDRNRHEPDHPAPDQLDPSGDRLPRHRIRRADRRLSPHRSYGPER